MARFDFFNKSYRNLRNLVANLRKMELNNNG